MTKSKPAWFFVPGARPSGGWDGKTPRLQLGGPAYLPATLKWPACRTCQQPMRYLGALLRAEGVMVIFVCAGSEDGPCEWTGPESGAHPIVLIESTTKRVSRPGPCIDAQRIIDGVKAPSMESTAAARNEAYDQQRAKLGQVAQLGGYPFLDHGIGDGVCPRCDGPGMFVLQLAAFAPLDELLGIPEESELFVAGCADLCEDDAFWLGYEAE